MAPYLQAGIDGLVTGNGNANSLYEVGRTAFRALEQAREGYSAIYQGTSR